MADACLGTSAAKLSRLVAWYIRDDASMARQNRRGLPVIDAVSALIVTARHIR
jgi:hypothetical protein